MRILSLIFLGCSSLMTCKEADVTRKYTLMVNEGSGSGSYPAKAEVSISANTIDGKKFREWTGDVATLVQVDKADTRVIMPESDVTVSATFSDAVTDTIRINAAVSYQTMDGFGFFGGRDVWWGSQDPTHFYSDAWLTKIISDLGMSIWRNELYPHIPPSANVATNQDAYWDKQKGVVVALSEKARALNADLKIILTAWTPPAAYKWTVSNFTWAGSTDAIRQAGPVSEKNGGTLNPEKYVEYAAWWNSGLKMYKDAGVDVYGLSLQNEPMFSQTFNSCVYTSLWYNQLLKNVVPTIKASYPDVKIFGSENMLEMEGKTENYQLFYHAGIKSDLQALNNLDIFAVHGYSDGVSATSGSQLAAIWTNHKNFFAIPHNKKTWMTETSGYTESWERANNKPGAFSLAVDIQTAINFGDVSAWVFWQGSELAGISEFSLMSDLTVGKKYYASKHFYRFIRPGAQRIAASSTTNDLAVSAFKHPSKNTQTVVVTNTSETTKYVRLKISGASPATSYEVFVTSATKNCESEGTKTVNETIAIPGRSVVTIQGGGNPL